jgi:hypothetical protein
MCDWVGLPGPDRALRVNAMALGPIDTDLQRKAGMSDEMIEWWLGPDLTALPAIFVSAGLLAPYNSSFTRIGRLTNKARTDCEDCTEPGMSLPPKTVTKHLTARCLMFRHVPGL